MSLINKYTKSSSRRTYSLLHNQDAQTNIVLYREFWLGYCGETGPSLQLLPHLYFLLMVPRACHWWTVAVAMVTVTSQTFQTRPEIQCDSREPEGESEGKNKEEELKREGEREGVGTVWVRCFAASCVQRIRPFL